MFLNLAKLDHIVFKLSGYDSVFKNDKDYKFSTHTECRFGKWYTGKGKEMHGAKADFGKIDAPHKNVHNSLSGVPKLISKGAVENADEIIESFTTAENNSKELFGILDRLG